MQSLNTSNISLPEPKYMNEIRECLDAKNPILLKKFNHIINQYIGRANKSQRRYRHIQKLERDIGRLR